MVTVLQKFKILEDSSPKHIWQAFQFLQLQMLKLVRLEMC